MQSPQTAITCPPYRGTRRTRGTPPHPVSAALHPRNPAPCFLACDRPPPALACIPFSYPAGKLPHPRNPPLRQPLAHPSNPPVTRRLYSPPHSVPALAASFFTTTGGGKQSNPAHPVSAAKHPTAEPAPSTRAGCARFLLLTRRVNRATHCALTPLCYLRATPAHTSPALRIVVSSSHPACNAHPTDALACTRIAAKPPTPAEHHYTPPAPTCWPATTHQHTIYTNHRPRSPLPLQAVACSDRGKGVRRGVLVCPSNGGVGCEACRLLARRCFSHGGLMQPATSPPAASLAGVVGHS